MRVDHRIIQYVCRSLPACLGEEEEQQKKIQDSKIINVAQTSNEARKVPFVGFFANPVAPLSWIVLYFQAACATIYSGC